MSEKSEPTTDVMVKWLRQLGHTYRYVLKETDIADNIDACAQRLWELDDGKKEAIGYLDCMTEREETYKKTIATLTDRAESAERERDAAIKALTTYEDALFDERDIAYNRGYSDGHRDGNSEQ